MKHIAWEKVAEDPVKAQEETYQPMKQWINRSLDEALEMKANVMVESTLRRYDEVAGMAERMKDAGHRVELEVVATPPEVSAIGVVSRFEDTHDAKGWGRHVGWKSTTRPPLT